MRYEAIAKPEVKRPKHVDSDLQKFIYSDCVVKECVEGNISIEVSGYSTLYNCPRCYRTSIPSARKYAGPVTFRDEDEMERRHQERKEIVADRDGRYQRAAELMGMLHDICKPSEKVEAKKERPIPDLPAGNLLPDDLIKFAKTNRVDSLV